MQDYISLFLIFEDYPVSLYVVVMLGIGKTFFCILLLIFSESNEKIGKEKNYATIHFKIIF